MSFFTTGMNFKKAIICDLDGTLALSKSPLSTEMAEVLCGILRNHYLVVISGGSYTQFDKQFLSHLNCPEELLKNLYLFPTMGGTCYVYDSESNAWKQLYEEILTIEERDLIKNAISDSLRESNMDFSEIYGELVDDRVTQVTLSCKGQEAPLLVKQSWDTDQSKRKILVEILKGKIPQFEIRIGGTTSIDITKKGIDKAFAIQKFKELSNLSDEDIIFVGDALFTGGNDAPVKTTGVDYIQESGPSETIAFLRQYL
ncbi:MAG: HAD-IIB family hydrolase [Candidatus Zambryskibacteria bacterium]|nr:HAD-IIB family hydrolase [Candidatus Zambryskibacteria bacterium]